MHISVMKILIHSYRELNLSHILETENNVLNNVHFLSYI